MAQTGVPAAALTRTLSCSSPPRSYAIKEVNIKKLQPRERCVRVAEEVECAGGAHHDAPLLNPPCPHTTLFSIHTYSEDAVNEIRIMASIKHKNIVRYCDAFVERDSLFIVMEFAEHGDISRQIDKFKAANKYIKEDTVWSYLIQMCYGLHCMHSRNVLHRDIKPKNVRGA